MNDLVGGLLLNSNCQKNPLNFAVLALTQSSHANQKIKLKFKRNIKSL